MAKLAFFSKVVSLMISVMFAFNASVSAMTFSQPIELGMLSVMQAGRGGGGIKIEGATSNLGNYFLRNAYNKGNIETYEKGVARYGQGVDALFVHYNTANNVGLRCNGRLGGSNIKNTVEMNIFCDVIYKIESDSGITLYPIRYIYGPASLFIIVGRQKDGTFVKFIDTYQLSQTYLGIEENKLYTDIGYELPKCMGDTIIMPYEKYIRNGKNRASVKGEFRFKWDDAAQWFGVEQVVY